MNNIPLLAGLIRPRDIRIEDKFDKILKAYLDDKIKHLPLGLQNALERWELVNNMLRTGNLVKKGKNQFYSPYKYGDLVKFIVQTYKVSIRTAYDDIKSAKRFFAVEETPEDNIYAKGLFLEKLEEYMAECFGTGDRKSGSALAKIIATIRKWDKEQDANLPKYAEMQLPVFIITDDPTELGFPGVDDKDAAVKRILAKRKKSKIDSIFADAEAVELMKVADGTENLA